MTFSPLSSPPCSPAPRGFRRRQRGQVNSSSSAPPTDTRVSGLQRPLFCMLSFYLLSDSSSLLHSLLSSLSSAYIDPFTSTEAGDESMPNLNPFLSKLVVDATHLPVVSSDGVSFSSRTSGHEVFGGNDSFCYSSEVTLFHTSVLSYLHGHFSVSPVFI